MRARSPRPAGGPSDVLHVAYGYGLFTGGLGLHYGGERLGATVVPASGGNTALQLGLLEDLGATGLVLHAELRAVAGRAGSRARTIDLRYGVFGAEPWSEAMREKLEAAWGIDACDIYGLSEVMGPGVAAECREGKGALHVFDDHFLPEIVDPATGEPTDGLGELVLTTLDEGGAAGPALPDRRRDPLRRRDCPCGRTHRRIARFSGRVDDMLIDPRRQRLPERDRGGRPRAPGAWPAVRDRASTGAARSRTSRFAASCPSAATRSRSAEDVRRRLEARLRVGQT